MTLGVYTENSDSHGADGAAAGEGNNADIGSWITSDLATDFCSLVNV